MKPSRPYLIRAIYDWLLDNNMSPYVVVNATLPHVSVPQNYVKDGQIVLNISPTAVKDLHISNQEITFNARFGGMPTDIYVPYYAVEMVYAKENGQGMMFGSEPGAPDLDELPELEALKVIPKVAPKSEKKKPSLKIVK